MTDPQPHTCLFTPLTLKRSLPFPLRMVIKFPKKNCKSTIFEVAPAGGGQIDNKHCAQGSPGLA